MIVPNTAKTRIVGKFLKNETYYIICVVKMKVLTKTKVSQDDGAQQRKN
jgi:hypothetical protein